MYLYVVVGLVNSLLDLFQEVANNLARLCVRACARLGGYFPESSELSTPENVPVKKSLVAMLTPFLARKLSSENSKEVARYSMVEKIFFVYVRPKIIDK